LRQEMEYDRENTSTAMFRHVWEGDYYDSVEDALISVEWFEAAIDAHTKLGFKPEGPIIASHDPSDLGPDAKGYCLRQGSVILDVKEMLTGDTNEGVDWAIDLARQSNADWFVWDGDGIGLGLRRQVMQSLDGSRINYEMFRGSEGAEDPMLYYGGDKGRTNKDTFLNRRAQYYWKLRDRFEATWRAVTKGEYIDPEELISNGKLQVLSKVDMKKKPYQIESPNMADAVMMSMFSPKTLNKQTVQINFSGWGK
jgi:phage terminase large subunit